MTIEQIPADQEIEMTSLWHKAFNIAGCNPLCHCCGNFIKPGMFFKLATIASFDATLVRSGAMKSNESVSKEVMLCGACTVEMMQDLTDQRRKEIEAMMHVGGGCYRINGRIIH